MPESFVSEPFSIFQNLKENGFSLPLLPLLLLVVFIGINHNMYMFVCVCDVCIAERLFKQLNVLNPTHSNEAPPSPSRSVRGPRSLRCNRAYQPPQRAAAQIIRYETDDKRQRHRCQGDLLASERLCGVIAVASR